MTNKGKTVKFKNDERKIRTSLMIYADFLSILIPKDNEKENLNVPYTNEHQNHVSCSYG